MLSLLSLGFLFGIAHAFEADHIAAVSSLVSGRSSRAAMVRAGAFWGLGHTLSLLSVGAIVMIFGLTIGPNLSHSLELTVGLMLILLGGHVLYRLRRDRVHFHSHTHANGERHLHLHSHQSATAPHEALKHQHPHPDRAAHRSLFVGMTHGLAGSAAMVVAAAAAFQSVVAGLGYILVFGAGSILGMATMTLALSVPLALTARLMTRANQGMQLSIGILTLGIGARIVFVNASVLGAGTLF